jgi:hypothetical protein
MGIPMIGVVLWFLLGSKEIPAINRMTEVMPGCRTSPPGMPYRLR